MAQGGLAAQLPAWRDAMRRAASRSTALLVSLGLLTATALTALSLVSYRPSDPGINTAAAGPAQNWLGSVGAYASETLLMIFGPLVAFLLPLVVLVALRLWRDAPLGRWPRSALLITVAIMLVGSALTLLSGASVRGLPLGWGGITRLWRRRRHGWITEPDRQRRFGALSRLGARRFAGRRRPLSLVSRPWL